jgi:hypothetical protein
MTRNQIQESESRSLTEYDRFDLKRAVGSYRDSGDRSKDADWSRPWTSKSGPPTPVDACVFTPFYMTP